MPRLIDADALKYEPLPKGERNYRTYNLDDAYEDGYHDAFVDVMNAPTIDAVPVVRCEDCKNYGTDGNRLNCNVFCCSVPENGFCSMGERKEVDTPTVGAEPQWIPCSERMPEAPFGCLVTVWDTDSVSMYEFENILPYFVGWDGEQWNDADGEQCPFEVLAWMPLPEPYEVEE